MTQPPLIGREVELARVEAARREGRAAVVLAGGAGVGKTRLAAEAGAAAERAGAWVERVRATRSAATVPLGAFAAVVPAAARADELGGLLRGSADAILARAGGRPVVLAVDDAQSLDGTSAALVAHLAATGDAFVLATVRTGDPAPAAIAALLADRAVEVLDLQPFTPEGTAALAEDLVGGTVERSALHWLHEASGGNALYLRELVTGALREGALELVREVWRLPRRPSVTGTLSELVTARMDELGDAERRTLELLAIGEPLGDAERDRLADPEAVAELAARGMALAGEGGLRLAHPLYGEAIRASLGVVRGRSARLALAGALTERGELEPDDALRVARWLLDAGEPIPEPLLLGAARAANLAGDPALCAQLAELAVGHGAGLEATLLLARAHVALDDFARAEEVLAAAEPEVRADRDRALAYLEGRIAVLYWGLAQGADVIALLDRAQGWWPDGGWEQALLPLRIMAGAAQHEAFGSRREESQRMLADPGLDPEVRRQMEPFAVAQLFYGGQTREAWELAERIRPAIPLRDPTEELAQILWSTVALESGLHWDRIAAELPEVLAAAIGAGDHAAAGFAAAGLGALAMGRGAHADAARWLREAELQFERRDVLGLLVINRAFQVSAAWAAGDPDAAASALARMREALGEQAPLPNQAPYVARAEAHAQAAAGDRGRAADLALAGARDAAETPVYGAMLLHEALRLGAGPRRLAPPLLALRERTDAPSVAAFADHAAARAASDPAALLRAAGALEAYGATWLAAEAAAEAAIAYDRGARADSARRAAARSRELSALGDGADVPALAALDGRGAALTTRERQLVDLAGQGLSNADIADRLAVSVRTVESHLYRAMRKLGVADRRGL